MRWTRRLAVAALPGLAAFVLYRLTMLPGMDLGDTPSFQTMVGEPVISARDAYPLYYALAGPFVWLIGGDQAAALNLFSAVCGGVAISMVTLLAVELAASLPAAVAATAAFATSYTFWSQSIIAEVYALHIALVALTAWLLLRWRHSRSDGRLFLFLLAYAVSFGNHLSMILLAPAYGLFLITGPGGWRAIVRPRAVALAVTAVALGALPYLWNFTALWSSAAPPRSAWDAASTFWFEVTKTDWRESMVFEVPPAVLGERVRMYFFDLRQQFGVLFPMLAVAGLACLGRTNRSRAAMLAAAFVTTAAFAGGYNVGDPYIFFLPAHLTLALAAAPGLAWLDARLPLHAAASALVLVSTAVRMFDNYPALDRSADRRPEQLVSRLTDRISDRNAILLTDLDWEVQNGLSFYATRTRRDLATIRLPEVLLHAPDLIADNHAVGRDVVLTSRARRLLNESYGPLFAPAADPRLSTTSLPDIVANLPPGTPYVLTHLRQSREFTMDIEALEEAMRRLTAGAVAALPSSHYAVAAGLSGQWPLLLRESARPFRQTVSLDGLSIDVRMESWLAFDTIRRMGFGHVIAGRRRVLTLERGISFVALDRAGGTGTVAYEGGIFAQEARYLLPVSPASVAAQPH